MNVPLDRSTSAPQPTPEERHLRKRVQHQRKVIAAVLALLVVVAGALAVSGWPGGDDTTALGTGQASVKPIGEGEASYYGPGLAGQPTASGETFDPQKMTAAHRTLPLGTRVRVTNLRNQESVVVRINDRGPYAKRRVIDLSVAAARELGMLHQGRARVRLEVLE